MKQLPQHITLDSQYQKWLTQWETELQSIVPYSARVALAQKQSQIPLSGAYLPQWP